MIINIAVGVFLFILVLYLYLNNKVRVALVKFRKQHVNFIRFLSPLIIVLSVFVTLLTDLVDFSAIFSTEKELKLEIKENLVNDVNEVYQIDNEIKKSIVNRIDELAEDKDDKEMVTLLLLEIFFAAYVCIISLNSASSNLIEQELKNTANKFDESNKKCENMNEIIFQIETAVKEKCKRIRTALSKKTESGETECDFCRRAIASEDQTKTLLNTVLHFIQNKEKKPVAQQSIRIAYYIPDNNNECLQFETSVDLHDDGIEITSPKNPELRHKYKINVYQSKTVAVQCYNKNEVIIIEDCDKEPEFEYFNSAQRKHIKSMLAFPLIHMKNTIGVIVVDTNMSNYFHKDENSKNIYEILGYQLAYRFAFENVLKEFFEIHTKPADQQPIPHFNIVPINTQNMNKGNLIVQ